MPTNSDIAASLLGMTYSISCAKNQTTLQAASGALEYADKRVALLEKRLAEVSSAAIEGDDLILVARGGEEVKVKACLAQCVSEYFRTALKSGCKEAVDKRFEFKDVGIEALRFIASGIHAGEACANIVALPAPLEAVVVEQIIDFASRLLMPWLARAVMQRALESPYPAMLVRLLVTAEGHEQLMLECSDADSLPSLWGELLTAAAPYVARMIEEAAKEEAFCELPLGLLQRILVLVEGPSWCDWHKLDVVATGAGEVRSSTTNKGFYLKVTKKAEGGVSAYVCIDEDEVATAVVIGEHALMGFEYEIEAWSRTGEWDPLGRSSIGAIVHIGTGWGFPEYLSSGECKDYVHGGSYKFRFRARRSKLQVQCHALLACMRACPAPETEACPRLIVAALELLRSSSEGLDDLHAMLIEYMAGAFYKIDGKVLVQLSFNDMEAIITHPKLHLSSEGELALLQGVLDWAQGSKRLVVFVGAEVRVRDDSEHVQWHGAECRVVEENDGPWQIQRASDPQGDMLRVKESDLLCSGHVGMERLLQHVKFPFIKLEQIKTKMCEEDLALAKRSPAFLCGLREAVDVQTGRRKAQDVGKRAQKRARYTSKDVIPEFDSWWCAKTLLGSR